MPPLIFLAGLVASASASAMELAATGESMIEVTEVPYHMVDKLEGVYVPWNGRHINGPVYRRTELMYKFSPFVPTFMGTFCGHIYGAEPSDWCIAQCEEEHMMHTGGLLLPCGGAPPDGTLCPAAAHDPPPQPPAPNPNEIRIDLGKLGSKEAIQKAIKEKFAALNKEGAATKDADGGSGGGGSGGDGPGGGSGGRPRGSPLPKSEPAPSNPPPPPAPRPAICEVIAHARRYTEAGGDIRKFPGPEWWRFRGAMGGWLDATEMSTGAFVVAPRVMAVPPPGERLRMRRDGTVRSGSRPDFCIGAEGGQLEEGKRLIFWDCGQPPNKHEKFTLATSSARGSFLRSAAKPGLCLVVPGGTRDLMEGDDLVGPTVLLGSCGGGTAGVPLLFTEVADGTIRMPANAGFCLRSGFDRPDFGTELRLERCSMPRELVKEAPPAAQRPMLGAPGGGEEAEAGAAGPGSSSAAGEILGAIEAMRLNLEAKLDSSLEKLESRMDRVEMMHEKVQSLMHAANMSGGDADNSSYPSCQATGGKGPCKSDKFF